MPTARFRSERLDRWNCYVFESRSLEELAGGGEVDQKVIHGKLEIPIKGACEKVKLVAALSLNFRRGVRARDISRLAFGVEFVSKWAL